MNKNDNRFVEALSSAFHPPTPDAEAFDARLQAKLGNTRSRRPVLPMALLAAAAVLLLVRPQGGIGPAETPATAPVELASIDTATTSESGDSLYRFDDFDPLDTSEFPEDYQRLATLFFQ